MIVSTVSGHVYVRSKSTRVSLGTASKPFSFRRIPLVNRVVKVAASPGGSFAVLSIDPQKRGIAPARHTLAKDLSGLLGYLAESEVEPFMQDEIPSQDLFSLGEDSEENHSISRDIIVARNIRRLLYQELDPIKVSPYVRPALTIDPSRTLRDVHGGDVMFEVQKLQIEAHDAIFHARCHIAWNNLKKIGSVSKGGVRIQLHTVDKDAKARLHVEGVHVFALLLLLQYLYTDDVAAIWDRRVALKLMEGPPHLKLNIAEVKNDLLGLAQIFGLPSLAKSLEGVMKIPTVASLQSHMESLMIRSQTPALGNGDLLIELRDRTVPCHSPILRMRSSFFQALLDDPDWMSNRKCNPNKSIDLRHIEWRAMKYAIRHMYCGDGEGMFEDICEIVSSVEVTSMV
jgi:hypothetical protein